MQNGFYRVATVNFLVNCAIFGAALFIPQIASNVGANGFQLTAIISGYNFSLFLTSWYFGRLADTRGKRYVMLFGLGISVFVCLAHIFLINSVYTLVIARMFFGAAIGIFPGALIAYAYERGSKKLGIYAGFGSAGTALGSLIVGQVKDYALIFVVCSIFMAAGFALAFFLPFTSEKKHVVPMFPKKVIKKAWRAYVGVLIRHSGATAIWAIFPVFLARIGCTAFEIGVLYAINTGTQAISMFFLDRYASTKLLPFSFALSALTFLTFTLASDFYQMIPTQIILGLSWATMYVGALKYINERNEEHSTASGLLSGTTSLANIIGPIITGLVIGNIALANASITTFHTVMYIASGFAITALVIYLIGDGKDRER
ncbi:MAG: MFS transporter [Thermoplasmata archaeon]|nr:MFS transporter [Thermoplasmata archaeon]